MRAMDTTDYETILKIVRDWPPAQRFMLIQEVLQTLARPRTPQPAARGTLDQARGLLATDQPPPSDREIAQWLDERRAERYGL